MFKAAANVGKKVGRNKVQDHATVANDRLPFSLSLRYRLYLAHRLLSPFLSRFYSSSLTPSFSLPPFPPLAIFLLLPFRDATMCVVRRGSRQGRLANNTLQFFRSPSPPSPSPPPPSARFTSPLAPPPDREAVEGKG